MQVFLNGKSGQGQQCGFVGLGNQMSENQKRADDLHHQLFL